MPDVNNNNHQPQADSIADARLNANRENAKKSTGPISSEGKAKSALNAVKCNLTGNTLLFTTTAEASRYAALVASYEKLYAPVGPEETALTQSSTDTRWRLSRIPSLEQASIALGTQEVLDENPAMAAPEAESALILLVRRKNEKELRNLALQETRLTRRRERETAELERIQAARKANEEAARKEKEEAALRAGAKIVMLSRHRNQGSSDIPGLGFVFSRVRFEDYLAGLSPFQMRQLLREALEEESMQTKSQEATA